MVRLKMTQPFFGFSVIFVAVLANVVESNSDFDFIVVGSGAGGGAVTRRLAESGKYNVLVIESGGLPKPGQEIPAYAPTFLTEDLTFNYESIRQQGAALYSNGTVDVIVGKVLGGTTTLNYMWYNRGHPRDWDNWAMVTGDDSWKYANMLKYFKKAETYEGAFPSDQHGHSGPVTVSQPRYAPGLDYWLAAGKELGYPVGDPNGPQKMGFHPVEFSKNKGKRASSFLAYLNPVLNNPNLKILTYTHATQIVFKGEKAIGIRYITNSTQGLLENIAYATKEIIVCAGTYGSALLLQRSGIGPKEVLIDAKIPILRELPVGQNYQDHAAINLNFLINNASAVLDEKRDLNQQTWQFYNTYGDGPFSNARGATGQAMMATSVAKAEGNPDWPDIQLCMSHSTEPYVENADLHHTINITKGEKQMSSSVFIGRPRSRGSVKINATDPIFGNPVLDVGYLRDPRDMQMFLDGIKETLKIYEDTKSYQSLAAKYAPIDLPGCSQHPVKSKQYWICYIQQVVQGGCHPAGTNKMGRETDPSSVVDGELKVIGIEGLRVADASIMPYITNANPHAAIYGIAEKAADMILNKWGSSFGGDIHGNDLLGSGGPLSASLKQSPYPEEPYFPPFPQQPHFEHKPQIPQKVQNKLPLDKKRPPSYKTLSPHYRQLLSPQFPEMPYFEHKPTFGEKPQSHIRLGERLNMLRNIFGLISKLSRNKPKPTPSHTHYEEHIHEVIMF